MQCFNSVGEFHNIIKKATKKSKDAEIITCKDYYLLPQYPTNIRKILTSDYRAKCASFWIIIDLLKTLLIYSICFYFEGVTHFKGCVRLILKVVSASF